jgi:hypothetical protein
VKAGEISEPQATGTAVSGNLSKKRPAPAIHSPDYYNPAAGYFDSWNRFRWKQYAH